MARPAPHCASQLGLRLPPPLLRSMAEAPGNPGNPPSRRRDGGTRRPAGSRAFGGCDA